MSFNRETGMYEGYIYCITNKVNGKQYIGQTSQTVDLRFTSHKSRANQDSNQYIHNSMRIYGVDNFSVEEIEKVSSPSLSNLSNELDKLEIHYINKFNTLNPNGYNNTIGGKENDGFQRIDRKVYQFDLSGKLLQQYNSLQDACDLTGFSKTGISKCCLLKTNSSFGFVWRYEDTLQDYNGYTSHWINDSNINVSLSGQHIMKGVIQYDLKGNIVQEYQNINDAYEQNKNNCTRIGINNCCYGNVHTHRGYVWRFVNDSFDKYPIENKSRNKQNKKKNTVIKKEKQLNKGTKTFKEIDNKKSIIQYDKNLKFIAEYSNISDISFLNESQRQGVIRCCKGQSITSHGYIWRFKGDDINKYKTQRDREHPVVMIMPDTNIIIRKFSTAKDAADFVSGDRSCIIKCCKGHRLGTHKGYKWKYADEFKV